ncbi:unnamed protein product, partial [Symbiodinium microadriaticum]
VWALAKVTATASDVADIVSATMSRVQDLAPQHIANVVWAMAKMSASSAERCEAFARPAWEAQQQFKPQEACNLLWAFAATTVHVRDAQMANTVAALSTQLLKQLGRCNPQDHANFMWAAVILSAADRHLADQVTQSASQQIHEFGATQLSAVVWAVSKGTFHEPGLFHAAGAWLAEDRNIEAMGTQHVANVLWSFAVAHQPPEEVPGLLAKGIALAAEFRTQELTGVLWAAAVGGWSSQTELLGALSKAAIAKALLFRADELASVAASVARLSQDTKVLKQLFFQRFDAAGAWQRLSADELAAALWALAQAKKHTADSVAASPDESRALEAAASVCTTTAARLTPGQTCTVLAALARLVPGRKDAVRSLLQRLQQGQPMQPAALVEVLCAVMLLDVWDDHLLETAGQTFVTGPHAGAHLQHISTGQLARLALAAGRFGQQSLATAALAEAVRRTGAEHGELQPFELAHLSFAAALVSLVDRPLHSSTAHVLKRAFAAEFWEAATSQSPTALLAERDQVYTAHLAARWLGLGKVPQLRGKALESCQASGRHQRSRAEDLPTFAPSPQTELGTSRSSLQVRGRHDCSCDYVPARHASKV